MALKRLRWRGGTVSPRPSMLGSSAATLEGFDLERCPLRVDVSSGRVGLVFLTTSCAPCASLWAGARAAEQSEDVIAVVPNPETENRRKAAHLAGPAMTVIMSSWAWNSYGVVRAPWLVVVADGVVVGDRPAPASWTEVRRLVDLASRI